MYKYLLLLNCCVVALPAHAQDQVEEVVPEVDPVPDPLADAPGHHGFKPMEPVITVTANGLFDQYRQHRAAGHDHPACGNRRGPGRRSGADLAPCTGRNTNP